MSIVRIESIPQTWTESDTGFFTIVARLFSPDFTYGASVLLAASGTDSSDSSGSSETATVASAIDVSAPAADTAVVEASRAVMPVVARRPR